MLKGDDVRLAHMLAAAREAIAFARDRSRDDLTRDRMLVLSLVKCTEIIGEAAGRITAETQQAHPQIPWASIVAMRNRLIHAYFDIDVNRVWDTIVDDLPALVAQLEEILPSSSNMAPE